MNEFPLHLTIPARKSYWETGWKQVTVGCSWAELLESHSSPQLLPMECFCHVAWQLDRISQVRKLTRNVITIQADHGKIILGAVIKWHSIH